MSETEWKTLFLALPGEIDLQQAATETMISHAESQLSIRFHEDLRGALLSANGVSDRSNYSSLLWPVEKIVEENLAYRSNSSFRELYMPFDNLLLFADSGNGDLFAYAIMADGNAAYRADIFLWDHEPDGRVWFAGRLESYIRNRSVTATSL